MGQRSRLPWTSGSNPARRNAAQRRSHSSNVPGSRKYQSRFAALGNLSARRDAVKFTTDPLARRMLEVLAATDVMVPPPDTGYSAEQANVFYELCAKLLTGKLTVAQAADYWTREKQNLARKGL